MFQKFFIFFSILRNLYLSLCILFGSKKYDVIVVDQLSISIPLLRLTRSKIFFYCHFPDQLLTDRKSFLKKLYRYPVDWLEETTTGLSDLVFVNSSFTLSMYDATFSRISKTVRPRVLYPSINFEKYDKKYGPVKAEQ